MFWKHFQNIFSIKYFQISVSWHESIKRHLKVLQYSLNKKIFIFIILRKNIKILGINQRQNYINDSENSYLLWPEGIATWKM